VAQCLVNPLNAELNPICHLLVLLGDLTFMGPCIVSISNKMQHHTVYLYLETALHVSSGTSTQQFPDINKLCDVASRWIYEYSGILLGARPILHISRINVKHGGNFNCTNKTYVSTPPVPTRRVQYHEGQGKEYILYLTGRYPSVSHALYLANGVCEKGIVKDFVF
jgi:hypothetical protein